MKLKVKLNPDAEFVEDMKRQIKDNGGYCPCRLTKSADTKCRCKEFRDMVNNGTPGMCHCGLFIAEQRTIEVNE